MADDAEGAPSGFIVIALAVVSAVLKIFLLVCVGIKLELQGMLDGKKRKCLSALAMDVCLPCLLFSKVLPEADPALIDEGWQLLLWPFVYCSVGALLGVVCCLLVGTPLQHLGCAGACAAFPNVNGFPVSIISALGDALPPSPGGFTPIVFLSLVQLTDGIVKYTVGPAIFERDLRALQRHRQAEGDFALPLGASLRSIRAFSDHKVARTEGIDYEVDDSLAVRELASGSATMTSHKADSPEGHDNQQHEEVTNWGLHLEQTKSTMPEWSRQDSYALFRAGVSQNSPPQAYVPPLLLAKSLSLPLLLDEQDAKPGIRKRWSWERFQQCLALVMDFLRQLFPPQVTAVILALCIGMGPSWMKGLFMPAKGEPTSHGPMLGFVYGTAVELGGGFVPMQMIALGGRLVNIASANGPLAPSGEAGPGGRAKLLRISAAVGVARMVLAPLVLFGVALLIDRLCLSTGRPMAFWAPALVVASMPTANNMSTMADLIGAGRSIAAASTAMQLLASPVVITATLSVLLAAAQDRLASDFRK